MEIKVGDKVRVSKDAPELYTMYGQTDWESVESTVEKIDGDAAEIKWFNENSDEFDYTAIPTKYLVKVDAEAKEAKYHKGEKVCYNGYVYEVEGLVGKNRYAIKGLNFDLGEDMIDPYEPYTEPTEQTEAKKKPNVGSIKIPVEVDLADSYWDAYTANLAKELALKVANKYSDPKQAAKYAVSVAKAVVEGLKRK